MSDRTVTDKAIEEEEGRDIFIVEDEKGRVKTSDLLPPAEAEIRAAAQELKQEIEKLVEVTKITEEIQEIKAREEERDRELKAALLSVVAILNRLHGWEPKKKGYSGG